MVDTPRMLPTIKLPNGKTYFVDIRLRQLRNIKNPHDYIDFDDESEIRLACFLVRNIAYLR